MAKGMYLGVNSKARKVKKMYTGVNGKARKVKKGYIGVGGKARPFFTGGELEYYGSIKTYGWIYDGMGVSSSDHHIIFIGGYNSGQYARSDGIAFDTNLIIRFVNAPTYIADTAGGRIGDYNLFAGGYKLMGGELYAMESFAFNQALTRTDLTNDCNVKDAAVSYNDNHCIIGTGSTYRSTATDNMYAFDSKLTMKEISNTHGTFEYVAAASTKSYNIFFGGQRSSTLTSRVSAYNASLTRTDATAASTAIRSACGCRSVSGRALFAGGTSSYNAWNEYSTVVTYTDSLTQINISPLSIARTNPKGVLLGENSMIAGGYQGASSGGVNYDVVDVYDKNLVRKLATPLKVSAVSNNILSGSHESYAIFANHEVEEADVYSI